VTRCCIDLSHSKNISRCYFCDLAGAFTGYLSVTHSSSPAAQTAGNRHFPLFVLLDYAYNSGVIALCGVIFDEVFDSVDEVKTSTQTL
jgi:hypothetical protein